MQSRNGLLRGARQPQRLLCPHAFGQLAARPHQPKRVLAAAATAAVAVTATGERLLEALKGRRPNVRRHEASRDDQSPPAGSLLLLQPLPLHGLLLRDVIGVRPDERVPFTKQRYGFEI